MILAATAGAVLFLGQGGSSAPRAGTTAAKPTGAGGGYCIDNIGGQYGHVKTPATICYPGTATKTRHRKTHARSGASTGDGYCIEDTEDDGTRYYTFSGDGDFTVLKGHCPDGDPSALAR